MEKSTEMDAIFERIFASQSRRKETQNQAERNETIRAITKELESLETPSEPKFEFTEQSTSPAEVDFIMEKDEKYQPFILSEDKEAEEAEPEKEESKEAPSEEPEKEEPIKEEPKKESEPLKDISIEDPLADDFDEIYENFEKESAKTISEMPNLPAENMTILEKFVNDYVSNPLRESVPKQVVRESAIREALRRQANEERLNTLAQILGPSLCGEAISYSDFYTRRAHTDINYHGKPFFKALFTEDESLLPVQFACTIRALVPSSRTDPFVECHDYINPYQFPIKLEEPSENYFVLSRENPTIHDASHNGILLQDDKYLIFIKNENSFVSAHFYQK